MHTEAEAKELWCPMDRTDDLEKRCIASECAMWRWRHGTKITRHGYCGLAGRPDYPRPSEPLED
jgi:hypothetical protein